MIDSSKKVKISFILAITVICLLIIAVVTWRFDKNEKEELTYLLVGIPLLLAWLLSIIGLSNAIASRKGKKTIYWYLGLIINGLVLTGAMIAIIINVVVIAKFFSLI